jgi:hypothetical protein
VKVDWGQEEVALQLFPLFSGPTVAAVDASIGKGFLVVMMGVIGVGLGTLLLRNWHELASIGITSTRLAKLTAIIIAVAGSICLEPYPLYLQPNGAPSFDIIRNLFVSFPPLLRSAGLIMLLIGIGGQGRRTLSDTWDALFARLTTASQKTSLFLVGTAGFIGAFLMAELAFHRLPSLRDEVAALFQAGIFAGGAFSLEPPPWSEFMDISCIITSPAWASMYPPGWSIFLAVGTLISAPWVIGCSMTALFCVMVFLILQRQASREAAWIGILLLLSSPFFLRLSGSYMSHIPAVALLSAFLYLSLDPRSYRSRLRGLVAGLALALTIAMRPLTAMAMALPVCLFFLKLLLEDWRQIIRFLVPAAGAVALIMVGWMIYNDQTTGFWYETGYQTRLGEIGKLGFGARIMGEHTLLLGLLHNLGRLFRLGEQWLGVPFAGAAILGLGIWLTPWNTNRRLLFAGFLLLWISSGLYWWYEHWFGPRYVFEALPVLLLVSSFGFSRLLKTLKFAQWFKAGLAVSLIWAFAALLPTEVADLREGYGEVDRQTVAQLRRPDLAGTVVVIEDSDMNAWPHDTYTSAFLAMVLDRFQGATMVRDLGSKNAELDGLLVPTRWLYYSHGDRTGEGHLEEIDGPTGRPRFRAGGRETPSH